MTIALMQGVEKLTLVIERMRIALHAMNEAGSLEHRRAAQAAKHLEFEIAPLLNEIDIDATIAMIASDAIKAYEKERGLTRSYLTLHSNVAILPGQRVQLTARPQSRAMRPERIAIPDRIADDFLIHDIRVGNRSQLENYGPLAGGLFAVSRPSRPAMTFETIQTAMDFVLEAEYVGQKEAGEEFLCNVLGVVARD